MSSLVVTCVVFGENLRRQRQVYSCGCTFRGVIANIVPNYDVILVEMQAFLCTILANRIVWCLVLGHK